MDEMLIRARDLLEARTPLRQDCGALCACACCRADADGQGGVWLLPGEEEALAGQSWARVEPGKIPLLMCEGACERALRPFFCRLFPLIGVRKKNGRWGVRIDRRARAMCPLAQGGARGLDPEFVRAAEAAVGALASSEEMRPYLVRWARIEVEFSRCTL